jgi:hypothetical protein
MVDRKDDDMRSDGFLSRWARRKQDVRAGKPVVEPERPIAPLIKQPVTQPAAAQLPHAQIAEKPQDLEEKTVLDQQNRAWAATDSIAPQVPAEAAEVPPPALTLQDAQALTPQSDFKPFMARDVAPDVKNAAMKKLFADPHYNVMDMMDTYVDDYSKPDPIPESMLRELASTKFLRLFERDEEEGVKDGVKEAVKDDTQASDKPSPGANAVETAPNPAGEDANTQAAQNVAKLNHSVPAHLAQDAVNDATTVQPLQTPARSAPKPL